MKAGRAIGNAPLGAIAVGLALASVALVFGARQAGLIEKVELGAYDHLLQFRQKSSVDERVTVVLESEKDIARFGHPLPDEVLAELLAKILAARPLAIAVDKYRDVPVAPGSEKLAAILAANDRIFWVGKFGDATSAAVAHPKAVRGTPFAACGDTLGDADGRVRRLLVYIDDGGAPCFGLGFSAARAILESQAVKVGFTKEGALELGSRTLNPLDPGDGPYATADFAGFQLPIEYEHKAFRTVALADVLDGKAPGDAFTGRAVFFGSAAESLHDFFSVPASAADGGRMTGVEVHAHAAATMLSAASSARPPLALLPSAWMWPGAIACSLATAFAILFLRRWGRGVAAIVGLYFVVYGVAIALVKSGYYFTFFPIQIAITLTGLVAFGVRVWREEAERGELMAMFSRQVSSEVANAMWDQRDAFYEKGMVPTQKLSATVFFLDIRSFTTVTEKLGADTVPWLNRGLGAMTDVVIESGGVVTRFVGDQIMAVYGVPVPRENEAQLRADAAAAVRAALGIDRRLTELNKSIVADGLPAIRVRIGICSGSVTQGAVGSSDRYEYTVFGDTVNTASRLESYATEDDGVCARVLIGESTYKLCGEQFACEALGSLALKGKVEEVRVYRVREQTHESK